jgi:hypothetical protein
VTNIVVVVVEVEVGAVVVVAGAVEEVATVVDAEVVDVGGSVTAGAAESSPPLHADATSNPAAISPHRADRRTREAVFSPI